MNARIRPWVVSGQIDEPSVISIIPDHQSASPKVAKPGFVSCSKA